MPLKLIPPGKRKGNRFYLVRGSVDGRRYEVSTQATDKGDALRFKAALEARIYAVQRDPDQAASVAEGLDLYEKSRTLSRNEQGYIDKLRAWFDVNDLTHEPLQNITRADLIEIANALYPGCKGQTWNRQVVGPIQAIVNLVADADPERCRLKHFKKFDTSEPERPIAMLDITEKFIKAADGEGKVVLMILAWQGWRISETLKTQRENIDFRTHKIRRWVSKSQKWKWTPLDPEICKAIAKLPERDDGFVFSWRDRYAFYRDVTKPLQALLGIRFTPHMARRGFATELIHAGADLQSIREAGNWESINSLEPYAQIDLDQVKSTLAKLRKNGGKTGGKRTKAL